MSFSLHAAGTITQARAQVAQAKAWGDGEQFEKVRYFLLSELDSWPEDTASDDLFTSGVVIKASGHADQRSRTVTITMEALWMPVTTAENDSTDAEPVAVTQ